MKVLGVLFPVVFIACEKACAKHLLTMAIGKLKREYPNLPKVEFLQDLNFRFGTKFYIPSTLNIDLILWHPQLIVDAIKC